MTWMRGLGPTQQSGHKSGLHIGETRGFVSWLLEGPGGPEQLLGETVGFACETHLFCVSLKVRTELSSTITELETTGFSNDQGVSVHHVQNQLIH